MIDAADRRNRAQQRYWRQPVAIKSLAVFMRCFRDEQSRWITRVGIVKALATSSTIAGWSIWKDYALIWGIIRALSQFLDAIAEYLPQRKQQRAASDLVTASEMLFIDAQFEWDAIFHGRLTENEILARWRKLARLQLEAERKLFPDGVVKSPKLLALARREVDAYFEREYGVGDRP